jgi:hypothetical protein
MACILIATTPVPGHVAPQAEAAGARHVPISHAADWSLIHPHERVPELRDQTGLDQVRTAFRKVFIDSAPGTLATSSGSWSPTMYGVYSRDSAPFGHLYCGLAGPDIAISAAGTSSICARIDRPRAAGPARRW